MGQLIDFFIWVVGSVLSRLIADEIKAWTPRIVERLIQRAARNLPPDQRKRFDEEWRSDVYDTPGDLSKLRVAFGFILASRRMSSVLAKASPWRQRRRYIGVAAAVSVVALVAVRELKIAYEQGTARLEKLLDQKDRDSGEKTAEANELARKLNEANTQLIDVRRQLEAKGQATLVQDAQNFPIKGSLTALQNLNLSGIPSANANPIFNLAGTPDANAIATLGLSAAPISSSLLAATGISGATANPTLAVTGTQLADASSIVTAAALSGTRLADDNPALTVTGTAGANLFSTGNANPTFGATATPFSSSMFAATALPSDKASPALIVTGTAGVNPLLTSNGILNNPRYTP